MKKSNRYVQRTGGDNHRVAGVFIAVAMVLVCVATISRAAITTNDWEHFSRIDFTYDNATSLTNFPVLVVLNSDNINGFTYDQFESANGYDLRFADSDGTTELNYEVETWNTSGSSYVWVQVPELAIGSYIWAYWGNTSAVSQQTYCTNGSTWDANYKAVWHLGSTNSVMDLRDSTANIKDGTNGTGANATVNGVGKISDGQYFDWNDSDFDYVTLPTNTHDFSGVFTVSLWAKFGAFNTFKNLIAKDQDSSNFAFVLYAGTGQDLGFGCKDAGSQSALASPVALSVNTWHHIAATIDGSNVGKIYVDGNMIATATLAYRNNHGSFRLGRTPDNFWGGLEGTMDEARVSSTVRLHNWINASWLNQTSNSVFNSYGPAYHRHRGDNWAYKMKIIFTGYTGSETLTNFPALVVLSTNLTDFAYSKFASSAGGDLRFTDSNELFQLNYEIEKWDTNGSSYVWAQVPLLSGTNTFIWAYWGNNNDTTVPSYTTNGTTWSEYYASVWHFDETIGTHEDSTDNGYDATSVAVTTQGSQEGQIDGSDDLNGNAGVEVRFPGISELSGVTKFTISAWTRIDSAQDWDKIFNVYSSNENRIQNEVSGVGYFGGANDVDLVIGTGVGRDLGYTTGDVLTPLYGQWAHWAIVYNGGGAAETDRLKFYLNGTNCNLTYNGTIPTQTQVNTQPAIVCSSVDCGADEMRISSVNRSADWLWACWMSQASNTVFNNYGSVDNYSIMLINNDASGVFGTTATMNGELRDNGGNATTIYLYFGTNDGGTNAGDWMTNINFGVKDVGLLATNIMDLLDDQTYYYRYYGTNTGGKYRWGFPSKSFNTVLLEGLVFEVE